MIPQAARQSRYELPIAVMHSSSPTGCWITILRSQIPHPCPEQVSRLPRVTSDGGEPYVRHSPCKSLFLTRALHEAPASNPQETCSSPVSLEDWNMGVGKCEDLCRVLACTGVPVQRCVCQPKRLKTRLRGLQMIPGCQTGSLSGL